MPIDKAHVVGCPALRYQGKCGCPIKKPASLWVIEEGVEGEGVYTVGVCASKEVAEEIVAIIEDDRGYPVPSIGIEEIVPYSSAQEYRNAVGLTGA